MPYTIKLKKFDPELDTFVQFDAECFGEAIVCRGHAALREVNEIGINDAPGQCWGEYIDAGAGSYDVGESRILERDTQWCIDDAGAAVEIMSIDSLQPFRMSWTQHLGVPPLRHGEKARKQHYTDIADIRWRLLPDGSGVEITEVEIGREIVILPGYIGGRKVKKADLYRSNLSSCRTLIVDSDIEELDVNFDKAGKLRRIEIGENTVLTSGPAYISHTPWFWSQPKGQVYLAHWYCGSVGGADTGESVLRLRPDCVGVAADADHRSYWKKIVFPHSVKLIGDEAFFYMPCLTDIEFAEGLESIGMSVFWNCPRVQSLYLPDSLEKIGEHSLDLMQSLQSASMLRRVYTKRDYFLAYCGELTIRDKPRGSKMSIKKSHQPLPVNGRLTAYAKGRTLYVNGRSYRNLKELTAQRISGINYLDIYGNKVRFFDYFDTQLYTGSKNFYYNEKRWYVQDEKGITEISRADNDRVLMVHENMGFEDLHPTHRKDAADLFGVKYDDEY